jgi:transaldolase
VASVASFFVSRVDTKVDAYLPGDSPLRGRAAIANAAAAFTMQQQILATDRWGRLATAGARAQRPLWASTGTKDTAYSDVVYVEQLIAPDVVNTMPLATLQAFADHGTATRTLGQGTRHQQDLDALARADIDLRRITLELEIEGIEAFCTSYDEVLSCIDARATALGASSR